MYSKHRKTLTETEGETEFGTYAELNKIKILFNSREEEYVKITSCARLIKKLSPRDFPRTELLLLVFVVNFG